ncbi:EAL domain-containing protein [Antrihabitans sp. YC2-6]|uniref:EAL domain-containing protein n=1 Tax=Antrihabitans sp. YC2-6 TaxID=2799498 RepID=UPI0018F73EF1|nr:EAL domain-containing protein [Antrihabitans sp. YC2-6]MBJ8344274.1 EAL domain-containing protein [Antrihabitans sp. YC2-6]
MPDALDDMGILRSVLDRSPDMISVSEGNGRVIYVNPAGLALVGLAALPAGEPLSTPQFFTHLGHVMASDVELALARSREWRGLTELRNFASGQAIPVEIAAFTVDRPSGQPSVIVSIIRDRRDEHDDIRWQAVIEASEYRAAEQEAVAELSKLALNGELEQLLVAATKAASTLMGVHRSMITRPIVGDDDNILVAAFTGKPPRPATVPAGNMSLMGCALLANDVIICEDRDNETRFSTAAMASYGFRSGVCVPIPGAEGPWGALSVHSNQNRIYTERDVSFLQTVTGVLSAAIRRLDLDRQLHERSMHDPLTGLPNRTLAYERIEQALAKADAEGTSIAVLLLDIDDFKIINDSLGHEAGDRALLRFASRLAAAARPEDTVARVGGDEFLVISDRIEGIAHAQRLAHALTESISTPHPPGNEPTPLSASIGIAVSEPHSTRQELIRRADLAMYRAKHAGTGGHAVFDHDDVYDADRTRRLSVDLRRALGSDDLNLRYQPLVDLVTGDIVAVEALARWTHADLGVIDPAEFVAVAERTGLVGELGEWALRTACAQAAEWRKFSDISVRVNVSALQLRDSAFVAKVAAVVAATGLEPQALGLEITETVWVADTARVAATLGALHRLGVGISLDDLGSGYSSINYLSRYPVFECFKIDRSYVEGLPAARPRAIVSAIVMLARAFDLTVVGEGVETVEQLETLRACGCDLAQGFLLGRPQSVADTTALLRSQCATRESSL